MSDAEKDKADGQAKIRTTSTTSLKAVMLQLALDAGDSEYEDTVGQAAGMASPSDTEVMSVARWRLPPDELRRGPLGQCPTTASAAWPVVYDAATDQHQLFIDGLVNGETSMYHAWPQVQTMARYASEHPVIAFADAALREQIYQWIRPEVHTREAESVRQLGNAVLALARTEHQMSSRRASRPQASGCADASRDWSEKSLLRTRYCDRAVNDGQSDGRDLRPHHDAAEPDRGARREPDRDREAAGRQPRPDGPVGRTRE